MADASSPPPRSWTERHPVASFQAATWALLTAMMVLPALAAQTVAWSRALPWVAAWAVCGVACSSAMGWVYHRASDGLLRASRVAFVVLPLALVGSAVWSGALALLAPLVGTEPWLPPELPPDRLVVLGVGRGALLLALWSGLFLVNELSARVQRAREHTLTAEALADQARLALLRSQVNPHFLFNALNSVVALIAENPRGAQAMVRDVATLLRRSLDADARQDTTVGDELAFVKLYLKCEQVRFEERLQVSFAVQDGVERLRMPPMLLQPLVENALKHGWQEGLPLRVHIAARAEGGRVVCEVRNSGSLQMKRDPLLPPSPGIGLENVRGRLAHLFPGQYTFEVGPDGGEVVARLSIPGEA